MDDSIFTLEYADSIPPLSKAAKAGDLEKIKKLISKGYLPQTPDNRGWTAIHCCVAANQLEALKLILKIKSKNKSHLVNLTSWENVTPLQIALKASKPSLEMVKVLLKAGADPNQCTHTKLSPLHLACFKKGNVEFVKLLVQFNADVNLQEDLCLFTPLHFAVCESCDLDVIKYLINFSDLSLKNIHGRTAFLEACNSNFLEAVKSFLEKDKNLVNIKSDISPVAYAGFLGNLEMAQMLLHSGADVNSRCKAIISYKTSDSDLILLDRENFLPIHSSLTNIKIFKMLLKLTKCNELLELETNYCSFPLFVMIYGGVEFFETLLQSDFPDELKIIKSDVLVKFILSYPDMEDIIIDKFPAFFKYNFTLEPEGMFKSFCTQLPEDMLCRCFKFLHILAKMGISSANEFHNKTKVVNLLESYMIECRDSEYLDMMKSTCNMLSKSVMSLKQYCRIVFRETVRSSVESDWMAVTQIRESELPLCLKRSLIFLETFSSKQPQFNVSLKVPI